MLQVDSDVKSLVPMPITACGYVPPVSDVVSPEVLAQVFEDKPLPFQTNPDGSVSLDAYLQWLSAVGEAALQAFEECSEHEQERSALL